jgi:hypothetical protein
MSGLMFFGAFLILIADIGCSPLGPKTIRLERTPYNLAIQETQDTQLLLNLVRLRYRDTPVFLELNGITSQVSFESGVDSGAEIQKVVPVLTLPVGK